MLKVNDPSVRWPRSLRICLGHLVAGIVISNTAQGMDFCLCVSVLCCYGEVEAFATGWSFVHRSSNMCLTKITKPLV
jgi:hypothetical protein